MKNQLFLAVIAVLLTFTSCRNAEETKCAPSVSVTEQNIAFVTDPQVKKYLLTRYAGKKIYSSPLSQDSLVNASYADELQYNAEIGKQIIAIRKCVTDSLYIVKSGTRLDIIARNETVIIYNFKNLVAGPGRWTSFYTGDDAILFKVNDYSSYSVAQSPLKPIYKANDRNVIKRAIREYPDFDLHLN